MNLSFEVLLEFLYNKFAVTFLLCIIGSFIRAVFSANNKKSESKLVNIKKIVTAASFSTFLMCACSVYIDLAIEIYILLCVLCGIWGLKIVGFVMSKNFIITLISNIGKRVADPVIKGTMETISEVSKSKKKGTKQVESKEEDKKDKNTG